MQRRYNGSAWVDATANKRWNGSAWQDCEFVRRWNGSAWVDVWTGLQLFEKSIVNPGNQGYINIANGVCDCKVFNVPRSDGILGVSIATTTPIDVPTESVLEIDWEYDDGYNSAYSGLYIFDNLLLQEGGILYGPWSSFERRTQQISIPGGSYPIVIALELDQRSIQGYATYTTIYSIKLNGVNIPIR